MFYDRVNIYEGEDINEVDDSYYRYHFSLNLTLKNLIKFGESLQNLSGVTILEFLFSNIELFSAVSVPFHNKLLQKALIFILR